MDDFEERCLVGSTNRILKEQHIRRYEFAQTYASSKRVLDIACGTGYGSFLLSEKADSVTGVDISEEAIEYAKKHYRRDNLKFLREDATDLRVLNDAEYDLIVSFETIEHIVEYEEFLNEAKRLMENKGYLIISTPNKKYASPESETPLNPFHVKEFAYDEFRDTLCSIYSDVVMIGQDYEGAINKSKRFAAKIIPNLVKDKLFLEKQKENFRSSLSTGIQYDKVDKCRYFIAICRP